MFASRRDDDGQAAPKATGQAVRAAKKAVHARGGAHIRTHAQAQRTSTRKHTHKRKRNAYAQAHKHALTAHGATRTTQRNTHGASTLHGRTARNTSPNGAQGGKFAFYGQSR